VPVRLRDWKEVYEPSRPTNLRDQASRCMDCGIPFCNNGCPLGNLIPDWNDLVYRDHWQEAIDRLHATNNFPEFTGRLCPAPCEAACVLGINDDPVTDQAGRGRDHRPRLGRGLGHPVMPPTVKTGKRVAVVGSGPAGLAAAQQLTRAGHDVVVFERADRIGGLLRYGIPEFKMEKRHLDRRLAQMEAEGTEFRTNVDVGVDVTVDALRPSSTRSCSPAAPPPGATCPSRAASSTASTRRWSTCPGPNGCRRATSRRRVPIDRAPASTWSSSAAATPGRLPRHRPPPGRASVHQFEIMPRPPEERPLNPWPTWPWSTGSPRPTRRAASGSTRSTPSASSATATATSGPARPRRVEVVDGRFERASVEGTDFELPADLVLLAMGFVGPERGPARPARRRARRPRQRGPRREPYDWMTNVDGVFVAGDMGRGQSLIVWAIAEGRACAAAVDRST
jgi:glutamate synthase (NADPH) small chain